MRKIPIYKAEASIEGLAERIQANSSISYAAQITPFKTAVDLEQKSLALANMSKWAGADRITAGLHDGDLYFTRSVLVTSNWNKNDDVFDRAETWVARNTPLYKPNNLGHIEADIVGHMISSWAIDDEGKLIADDCAIDDVPDKFHIVTGDVIYTTWRSEELQERTAQLIAEIEAGTKYVSMECLFSNFAYAVVAPDGKFYTLARNQETAFLTKHLRAYGGTGKFEGHQLGRMPLNIVFSGKGYVDNPGNPESIILSSEKVFSFASASQKNPFNSTNEKTGVLIHKEDTILLADKRETDSMSDNLYKEQNDKLEAKVAALTEQNAQLLKDKAEAGLDKTKAEVETLKAQVVAITKERDELATAKTSVETAKAEVEKQLAEATKAKDELQAKVTKAEADAKTAQRVSELVSAGAKEDDAKAKVSAFAALDDAQWTALSEVLKTAYAANPFEKKEDDKKKEEKKDKAKADADDEAQDAAAANADPKVLENAQVEGGAALAAAGSTSADKQEELRKEVFKAVAERISLGKKSDKK